VPWVDARAGNGGAQVEVQRRKWQRPGRIHTQGGATDGGLTGSTRRERWRPGRGQAEEVAARRRPGYLAVVLRGRGGGDLVRILRTGVAASGAENSGIRVWVAAA
jgi:hypothetical protein